MAFRIKFMTNYATLNHLVTQYLSRDFQQLSSVILTKKIKFSRNIKILGDCVR